MGTKSHKLLVNSDLVSPNSALGKESVLIGCDLRILKEGADLCLKLITVANNVLCGNCLNLVGILTNKLKLALNVVLCLLSLTKTHLVVTENCLVKHALKELPLSLKVLLGLIVGEDFLIAGNGHNTDVILKSELITESVKRGNIAFKVSGIKTNVTHTRGVIINGNENVNLRTADSGGADMLLNSLLKEDICSGKLYVTIKESGVYTLDLNSNILCLAGSLCTAKGGH